MILSNSPDYDDTWRTAELNVDDETLAEIAGDFLGEQTYLFAQIVLALDGNDPTLQTLRRAIEPLIAPDAIDRLQKHLDDLRWAQEKGTKNGHQKACA